MGHYPADVMVGVNLGFLGFLCRLRLFEGYLDCTQIRGGD